MYPWSGEERAGEGRVEEGRVAEGSRVEAEGEGERGNSSPLLVEKPCVSAIADNSSKT